MKLEVELTDAQLEAIAERVAELVVARDERWLSPKELADHLGCSVRTVSNYQTAAMPHLMVGNRPRFKASECEAWLTARGGRGKVAPITNGAAQPPEAPGRPPAPGPQEAESYGHEAA